MPAGPPTLTPAPWPVITQNGYNFAAIVQAIKFCILAAGGGAPLTVDYQANFEGVVRGLADLANLLQGHLARSIVYDPADPQAFVPQHDGSLMFDQRQGRLLVRVNGEWFQTNGAESLVHIGPEPPRNGTGDWIERQGQLWLDSRDGRFYIYVQDPLAGGHPDWFELPGSGGQSGPQAAAGSAARGMFRIPPLPTLP